MLVFYQHDHFTFDQSNLVPLDDEDYSTAPPTKALRSKLKIEDEDAITTTTTLKAAARPKSFVRQPADPDAIRTLRISNLPVDVTHGALWKKVRKQKGAVSVNFPIAGEDRVGVSPFSLFFLS